MIPVYNIYIVKTILCKHKLHILEILACGTKRRLKNGSASLCHSQRKLILMIANWKNLRIFPICLFTRKAATANGILLLSTCSRRAAENAFSGSDPTRENVFGAARRPRQTRNKNNHSAEYVQSAAEHIKNRFTVRFVWTSP